jgi:hypothetical protein
MACDEYLQTQIALGRPALLVLLGNTPTKWILKTTEGISKLRGRWFSWKGMSVLPMFHPSYLLRYPSSTEGSPKHLTCWTSRRSNGSGTRSEGQTSARKGKDSSHDAPGRASPGKAAAHVGWSWTATGAGPRKGASRVMGHHAGVKAVERVVQAAKDWGIRTLSLYAFSTENWKRPQGEVLGLMGLFRYYLRSKLDRLRRSGPGCALRGGSRTCPRTSGRS